MVVAVVVVGSVVAVRADVVVEVIVAAGAGIQVRNSFFFLNLLKNSSAKTYQEKTKLSLDHSLPTKKMRF